MHFPLPEGSVWCKNDEHAVWDAGLTGLREAVAISKRGPTISKRAGPISNWSRRYPGELAEISNRNLGVFSAQPWVPLVPLGHVPLPPGFGSRRISPRSVVSSLESRRVQTPSHGLCLRDQVNRATSLGFQILRLSGHSARGAQTSSGHADAEERRPILRRPLQRDTTRPRGVSDTVLTRNDPQLLSYRLYFFTIILESRSSNRSLASSTARSVALPRLTSDLDCRQ